jgi:hypothetical protein
MSVLQLFDVQYRFVKAASNPPAGQGGPAWQARLDPHRVTVSAASGHPKDILAVLAADVTVPGGFSIEIIQVQSAHMPGTEGNTVLA